MAGSKRNILFYILIAFSYSLTQAQNIKVPQNALLIHLLRDTNSTSQISLSYDPIIPQPAEFSKHFQQIVKSGTSLYVFIDGTGRTYKASNWDKNWVNFERLDSTIYFGYNKGAQKFINKDSIYSFGGYGFWHFNSCLTYFTNHKEWEVLQLDKEIPYFNINDRLSSISQFDPNEHHLYYSAVPIAQQSLVNTALIDSFYVLDLNKRKILSLGRNNIKRDDFIKFIQTKQVQTPWGILFDSPYDDNRDFLLNIKTNQIYYSETRIVQQLVPSSWYQNRNVFFYQNGYMYVSTYPFEKIDSLKFDITYFKLSDKSLYDNAMIETQADSPIQVPIYWIFISLFATGIAVAIAIYFYAKKSKPVSISNNQSEVESQELLTELEKQLLKEFIAKVEKYGTCSTVELNNLLGVSNKSIEIKKKARTDFITKVNYKLMEHFASNTDIITRERSEDDKRSFLYSISKDKLSQVKKLL